MYIILYYVNEHIFKCIYVCSLHNILEFTYMENINFITDLFQKFITKNLALKYKV